MYIAGARLDVFNRMTIPRWVVGLTTPATYAIRLVATHCTLSVGAVSGRGVRSGIRNAIPDPKAAGLDTYSALRPLVPQSRSVMGGADGEDG